MKISVYKGLIFCFLLAIAAASYNLIEEKKNQAIEKQKMIAIQNERDAAIKKKAKELDADYSWVKKLEKILDGNVTLLSYQVEKLWLTDKPILFLGKIVDVKRNNDDSYTFNVKNSMRDELILAGLEINIKCDIRISERYLNYMDANKAEFEFEKPVAVFAKINSIESDIRVESGNSSDVKIGIGSCLELMPSTDNYFFAI
jgi:hypothetical protein